MDPALGRTFPNAYGSMNAGKKANRDESLHLVQSIAGGSMLLIVVWIVLLVAAVGIVASSVGRKGKSVDKVLEERYKRK